MLEASPVDPRRSTTDVIICGGGLAGLLLGRQLRRELPQLSVTILERTRRPLPDAAHKVGESSVEIASQYLEKLGLREYLLDRQLVKFGLRFFPGGGHLPLAARTEIGPSVEPIVRSYQLDRGRLEDDLRAFDQADGVELIEGANVLDVTLGTGDAQHGGLHIVEYERDGQKQQRTARWLVDAAGRSAIMRKKLRLTRGSGHGASASWFRIRGRLDINDLVPREETAWHARDGSDRRWRSTNHLMGPGYWVWIIPLSTGNTSIGIVVHNELHEFHTINTLESSRAFIAKNEPVLDRVLDGWEVLDFLCLKGYSHGVARGWSADRWAMVGEAGAFVDPLYSPGSDFIAYANSFTVELIRTDLAGGALAAKTTLLNGQYRSLFGGTVDLFRQAAPVYGHARAMAAKLVWDNFTYWSFSCQYFQQSIFRLEPEEHAPFAAVGMRFIELSNCMQTLFRAWAELAPQGDPEPTFRLMPVFPSMLVDAHIAVGRRMTPPETLDYMRVCAKQAEEMASELVLRVVQELGPEVGEQLLDRLQLDRLQVEIAPERLEIESAGSLVRHRRLSTIAKDIERSLGPVRRHPEAVSARELLAQGRSA